MWSSLDGCSSVELSLTQLCRLWLDIKLLRELSVWMQHGSKEGLQGGHTAIHLAAEEGHRDILSLLIDKAGEINLLSKVKATIAPALCSAAGWLKGELNGRKHTRTGSALHLAIDEGHMEMAKCMITSQSADLLARNVASQRSALHLSIESVNEDGRLEFCKWLIGYAGEHQVELINLPDKVLTSLMLPLP